MSAFVTELIVTVAVERNDRPPRHLRPSLESPSSSFLVKRRSFIVAHSVEPPRRACHEHHRPPSPFIMLGRILVFVGFVWELRCEWVQLPKLDPWVVEPVKHQPTGTSGVHLIRHDMVKAPGVQVLSEVTDNTRYAISSSSTEKGAKTGSHIGEAIDADKAYDSDKGPMSRIEISKGSSNQTFDNRETPSITTKRPSMNHSTSSKPSLADWESLPERISTIQDKSGYPQYKQAPAPPTQPSYAERYPNKSYTYLDPLIESLMLKVHRTLVSNAGQPIKQKIHYLQLLQNNIMDQIWKRSQRLWVVEGPQARGNDMVTFPSLEGALLTISFLTFAVFLIRIVRQFIHGMQGTNSTVIDVTPTRVRQKRDLLSSQTIEILRMMEEFHLQHSLH